MDLSENNHFLSLKINICFIISSDIWAGAENSAFNQIIELNKKAGINVSVITFNKGRLTEELAFNKVDNFVIDERNSTLKMVYLIIKVLRNKKINITHVHGYKEAAIGGFASKLLNIKVVRTYHGKGLIGKNLFYNFIERVILIFLIDVSISVSRDLANFLKINKLLNKKNYVFYNSVNNDLIADNKKNELIIPEGYYVIGIIGRLVPVKNHDLFIKYAIEILSRRKNFIFIIVGDGPLYQSLNDTISETSFRENFKMLGFRNDVSSILESLDLLMITSYHEGIPMVMLEAMAKRVAVTATNVGGIPEVIEDNVNGLIIGTSFNEKYLINLFKIIDDKRRYESIINNGLKTLETRFDIKNKIFELISIYKEMMK